MKILLNLDGNDSDLLYYVGRFIGNIAEGIPTISSVTRYTTTKGIFVFNVDILKSGTIKIFAYKETEDV
jgi:hypothetical protein